MEFEQTDDLRVAPEQRTGFTPGIEAAWADISWNVAADPKKHGRNSGLSGNAFRKKTGEGHVCAVPVGTRTGEISMGLTSDLSQVSTVRDARMYTVCGGRNNGNLRLWRSMARCFLGLGVICARVPRCMFCRRGSVLLDVPYATWHRARWKAAANINVKSTYIVLWMNIRCCTMRECGMKQGQKSQNVKQNQMKSIFDFCMVLFFFK